LKDGTWRLLLSSGFISIVTPILFLPYRNIKQQIIFIQNVPEDGYAMGFEFLKALMPDLYWDGHISIFDNPPA
jgi:hypothetical protein